MTQVPSERPIAEVQPQPNIYTLLLIVAIVALVITIGVMLYNLLSKMPAGYDLNVGQVFSGDYLPKQ